MNEKTASIQEVSIPATRSIALRRLKAVGTSLLLGFLALLGLYATLSWRPAKVMAAENIDLQPEISSSLKRNVVPDSDKFVLPAERTSNTLMAFPPLQIEDDIVTTIITIPVALDSDDAGVHANYQDCGEGSGNPEIYLGRCDYLNGRPITSGLRFEQVSIPSGATLADVFLRVYQHDTAGRDIPITNIFGELNTSSSTFSTGNLPSDRVNNATTQYAEWDTATEWTNNQVFYNSPSLLTVTQEIMNLPGWVNGNPITFLLVSSGCMTPSGTNACINTSNQRFWSREHAIGSSDPDARVGTIEKHSPFFEIYSPFGGSPDQKNGL